MGIFDKIFSAGEQPQTPAKQEADATAKMIEKHSTFVHNSDGSVTETKPSGEKIIHPGQKIQN